MFRHPLLQHFTLSVFCKLPVAGMTKMADLRRMFLIRIILSVFQFRINKRCVPCISPAPELLPFALCCWWPSRLAVGMCKLTRRLLALTWTSVIAAGRAALSAL
jgi:hypothetical protein